MSREFDLIVIFQSKASGDVIMLGDVAHHMMKIMGKDITPQGIVTVEQLPDAIARLHAAVAQDKEAHQRLVAESADRQSDSMADAVESSASSDTASSANTISLTQRAYPLLELLTRSLHQKTPVVWGV